MNWTVLVLCGERPVSDDPGNDLPPLGDGNEVRRRISDHLPGVDWSCPDWGLYVGDGFTLDFNVGSEEPLVCVAVHVRGGGDAIADLLRFTVPNRWHLIDGSTGEVIDPASPSYEGWHGWQTYRDKIRRLPESGGDG